jgi:ATP-dependent RNA helicase SUPV3L1/SUV3
MQVGLNPTADHIELFAFHLPDAPLSNLIDVFMSLSKLDEDKFFMCNMDDFKFLADSIQHIPIPIKQKYVLCCSPIDQKESFACSMFLKIARQFSNNEPITFAWFSRHLGLPYRIPETLHQIIHLESVFDVCDMYLWLRWMP